MADDTLTVAGQVARFLHGQEIERIYSLPGGHMKPIWDELSRLGIRIITARHEAAAVHMAQAEADLRGRLAVAVVTSGPGLTNALTGIACAYLAESPVLVIAPRVPGAQVGMGALEEIEQAALVRPIARFVEVATHPRPVLAHLDRAVSAALGDDGPPGPAYLEITCDLLDEPAHPAYGDAAYELRTRLPRPPDPTAVVHAAQLIRDAARPVVLSGRDGVSDRDALAEFVSASGSLYLDTRASRGAASEEIEAYVPARRSRVMAEADLVVTLGRTLDFELGYGSPAVYPHARFVRIGRNFEETSGNRRADAEIRGDVAASLRALLQADCAPANPDLRWRAQMLEENAERVNRSRARRMEPGGDGFMHPVTLLSAVNQFVDESTIVVVDGGDILSFARSSLRTPTYLDLGPFGCLGVGTPFAVAAALNFPSRRVIAVVGDGAFGFHAMEIETAVRQGTPIVVVVANNGAYNIERHDQLERYAGRVVGTELSRCAFDELARALGAYGEAVTEPGQLPGALERALANAPAVINVAVTRDAVSPDLKGGLVHVPSYQALERWDDAERMWAAVPDLVDVPAGTTKEVDNARDHSPTVRT